MTQDQPVKPSDHALGPLPEHVDVLVVGAGISGIGAAYHLTTQRPGSSFVVLEAQESFGGTWHTHRYPGVRSDSDLHTFGYRFKPWTGKPIGTGPEIIDYLGEVIEENGLGRHIRYGHRIIAAHWSSVTNLWTVEAQRGADAERCRFTCSFLWMCQGYYRHAGPYTPDWPGKEDFRGPIVHPQIWPAALDVGGKRVTVIGSGATAATLVPALAARGAHVTLLQRSPSYYFTGRNANELADTLRELKVDETWIHEIVRRKLLHDQALFNQRCLDEPDKVREELIAATRAFLPAGYDVARHFTPRYRPWRQRLCVIPDGDLLRAVARGQVTMVTDEIERFTPNGIRVKAGEEIHADIVVTATGFHLSVLGDIEFAIDGEPLVLADTVTYRGMMFTGVPNMAWVFGYFRSSWTLRADLVADFVCRLLGHMEARGARRVQLALRPEDAGMSLLDWIDPEDFNPGYLLRDLHRLPRRGTKREWQHTQDYWREKDEFPAIDLDGEEFIYA
ncbi:MAG: NAD(P)/FAD-dependent oxidoreductase [Rhodospirillales bacterium]|nr:NAD(P)/FAD-dependent oxidoreductase [Rhodospirillales bacterium]